MTRRSQKQQQPTKKKRRVEKEDDEEGGGGGNHRTDTAAAARFSGKNNTTSNNYDDLQERCHSAKVFICQILQRQSKHVGTVRGDDWKLLPKSWRQDKDVAFSAFAHGHVAFKDLPQFLQTDKDFIVSVVQEAPQKWYSLPKSYRKDPVYAKSIMRFDTFGDFRSVLLDCPALRDDREFIRRGFAFKEMHEALEKFAPSFLGDKELMLDACRRNGKILRYIRKPLRDDPEIWEMYIKNEYELPVDDAFWQLAPAKVLNDTDLMLKACRRQRAVLRYVDATLLERKVFVKVLLLDSPLFLEFLPKQAQLHFPDLVIQSLDKDNYPLQIDGMLEQDVDVIQSEILRNVADDFLERGDFVKNWIGAGGYYFPDLFPTKWKEDVRFYEWFGLHGHRMPITYVFFHNLPDNLRRSKEFMSRMIKKQPFLYWTLRTLELKTDYKIALLAATDFYNGLPNRRHWRAVATSEWSDNMWAFFTSFCQRVHSKWRMGCPFPGAISAVDVLEESSDTPARQAIRNEFPENPKHTEQIMNNCFLRMWKEGEGSFTSLIREFADMPSTWEELSLLEKAVVCLPEQPEIDDYFHYVTSDEEDADSD